MLRDIERLPRKVNWASLVRHQLMTLGFYDVLLGAGGGNFRLVHVNFVQNRHSRLEESSLAIFIDL